MDDTIEQMYEKLVKMKKEIQDALDILQAKMGIESSPPSMSNSCASLISEGATESVSSETSIESLELKTEVSDTFLSSP